MYLDILIVAVVVCIMQNCNFYVHNLNCPLGHMANFARISFWELLYVFFFSFISMNFIFFPFNSEIFSSVFFFFSSSYLASKTGFSGKVYIPCVKANNSSQHTTQGSFRDRREKNLAIACYMQYSNCME